MSTHDHPSHPPSRLSNCPPPFSATALFFSFKMVGWSNCLTLTLGLASSVHAFVPAAHLKAICGNPVLHKDYATTTHPHVCTCPARAHSPGNVDGLQSTPGARRRVEALVLMARGRRGRGGGGWQRRRRQDANPIEFDKYGFPIPPQKPAKELEEEHREWMESIEPPEGFPEFDAAKEGFSPEEMENDPLLDPAV